MTPDDFINEAGVPPRRQPGWGDAGARLFVWSSTAQADPGHRGRDMRGTPVWAADWDDALEQVITYVAQETVQPTLPEGEEPDREEVLRLLDASGVLILEVEEMQVGRPPPL